MKENLKFIALGFLPAVFSMLGVYIITTPVLLFIWGYIGYANYDKGGAKTYFLLHLPLIIAFVIWFSPLQEISFFGWFAAKLFIPFLFIAGTINELILGFSTLYLGIILTFIIISAVFFIGRELAKAEWGFVR
ncbi:MAG: hypothetical protein IJE55_05510 [Clostridia bacterium]|nr:hypothetical protein [Clostridia bacterium]